MFVAFVRALKFSWQDFLRNWWLSFITVTVVFVTLFSVNLLLVWSLITDTVLTNLRQKVDVSLYMKPTVKELTVAEARTYILGFSEVKDVTYVTRDEALEKFKKTHERDDVILESLDELTTNPLGSTLIIHAKSPEGYQKVIEKITSSPYNELILDKSFGDQATVIDRIAGVTQATRKIGFVTSIVFALIALLIVFNTIRITIYTHRDEIGIMKRVGATNWFTSLPFLIEGIFYGTLGFLLATGLFFPFLRFAQPSFSLFFADYVFNVQEYFLANALLVFGIEFLTVVLTCVLSSAIATRRYLRV